MIEDLVKPLYILGGVGDGLRGMIEQPTEGEDDKEPAQ